MAQQGNWDGARRSIMSTINININILKCSCAYLQYSSHLVDLYELFIKSQACNNFKSSFNNDIALLTPSLLLLFLLLAPFFYVSLTAVLGHNASKSELRLQKYRYAYNN